jgi:NOL1/NOP2/sun family putative RNA methylase
VTSKLPPEFVNSINALLKGDAVRFWQSWETSPAFTGIRVNPQKSGGFHLKREFSGVLDPLPWDENGYLIRGVEGLGKHPFHGAGMYYLQEPSAMAPVPILDPQPGERVLDLCAAPGGKTTQIQASMKGLGIIVANDPNPRRVQSLALNTERWGARNITVLCETPQRLADHFGGYFDRVLVDAPCSGEGTFRSHPGEVKKWSPKFIQRCALLQDEIIWYAGKLVRPGGVLVYSTCTFNQVENEGTITRFLDKEPGFDLDPIPITAGFSPGLPFPDSDPFELTRAVRIWPHLTDGEGHFIARMLKKEPGSSSKPQGKLRERLPSSQEAELYQAFFDHHLHQTSITHDISPGSKLLSVYGNRLYQVQSGSPALEGLNVQHWGWWLGTYKSDRFIPSPALAAGIRGEDAQKVLEFSLDEADLAAYQRGSPVKITGDRYRSGSWVLVTVSGVSLGWGKTQEGRLKSYYPSWLRIN